MCTSPRKAVRHVRPVNQPPSLAKKAITRWLNERGCLFTMENDLSIATIEYSVGSIITALPITIDIGPQKVEFEALLPLCIADSHRDAATKFLQGINPTLGGGLFTIQDGEVTYEIQISTSAFLSDASVTLTKALKSITDAFSMFGKELLSMALGAVMSTDIVNHDDCCEQTENMNRHKSSVMVDVVREGDSYSAVETKVVTQSDGAVIVRVFIKG